MWRRAEGGDPAPEKARGGRRARRVGTAALVLTGLLLAAGGGFALWRAVVALGPVPWPSAQDNSTVVLDRSGRLLRAFTAHDGRWRLPVAAKDVDQRYLRMLVAFEDRRFYAHHGIDPYATLRAAWQLVSHGHVVSGASTLTMQVARLMEPRADRNLSAKLRQMIRAVEIDHASTKARTLGLYLTLAPYGGNIEGVRAASIAYFGKEPKRLTVAEAALLVALPQSPEARRPDRFPRAARRARASVLARAVARRIISAADAAHADAEPVPTTRRAFPALAPHAAQEAVEATPNERTIRLTIDARLQAAIETLVRERLAGLDPRLSAAVVAVDNATGQVRAYVGSPDYLSEKRSGSIDMARALRSPGSALKPFIYAMAFDDGIAHPETLVEDRPARYGDYHPKNFDLDYQGTVTARQALQMSLNLPAVALLDQVDPVRFLARLRATGANVKLPDGTEPGLAIGLGGVGIALTDMARLYAGLARGGEVLTLVLRRGEKPSAPVRFTDAVPAWYVWDILKGAAPPANGVIGQIAFKTGTSYGYRDAWAVGFDKNTTIAVWVGRPDNGAVPGLVGRVAAGPILFDAFARLDRAIAPIDQPPGVLIARTAALPPPLRRLTQPGQLLPRGSALSEPLKIAYPPNGGDIDLGMAGTHADAAPLALKALGGAPPLTWMVNGAPVLRNEQRHDASVKLDGPGFLRLTVIDAHGASDSVSVRAE